MPRGSVELGELAFLQALMKRGFVNIPRVLFDYTADLGLDYGTIGKMFALMACVGGPAESAFGSYTVSRRANLHDFDQMRLLIEDLEQQEIVRSEENGDEIRFSFVPLFAKLRAIWDHYREQYEEEVASGVTDPALVTAERLLGRPLSDREVLDIQDWGTSYGYEADMVHAIIREGQRQGVTRMPYLNQIAKRWFEEGVRTPEEAEIAAQRLRKSAGKHQVIISYLGLKRQFTGGELSLLDKWTEEWGFSNEVIMRACDEAKGVHNPLQYVNRVLESWRERGVKTLADVEQVLSEFKRRSSAVRAAEPASRSRKPASNRSSNVFLQREKKDENYYDFLYKKFDD